MDTTTATHLAQISVSLPPAHLAALKERAERRATTRNEEIREAVRRYLGIDG